MMHWPKSRPDYRWPPRLMAWWMLPLRWLLAGIFHLSYAMGLLVSLVPLGRRVRVLVIRSDGLGDGLLFEPALENLARVLSPRVIHLWAPQLTCDLFRHCPTIARTMVIPRGFKPGNLSYFFSPFWRIRLGFALGRRTFDKVIYPVESPEPFGNWLFASVRATERWINSGDTANQFDWQQSRTQEVATKIIEARPGNAHELLRNEYLAEQWSGERTLRQPKVHLTDGMKQRAESQVDLWRAAAKKRGGEEVIGVMPAASTPIKSYPDIRWTQALKRIWEEHRAMPVLLGGPSDGRALDALASALNAAEVPHQRLVAPLKILDMAALVTALDGLIGVDTGLAHLSVAQGVPTIVLVTGGNPGRFFPWPNARHHVVLNVPMNCSGCNDRCTLPEAECITHIPPEDIAAAYARLKGRRVSLDVMISPQTKSKKPLQQAG